MALLLIQNGFSYDQVYYKMSYSEFLFHVLTLLKSKLREQQTISSTLISTVGSFFVKKGEPTFIESIEKSVALLDNLLGNEIALEKPKKRSGDEVMQELFKNWQKANNLG